MRILVLGGYGEFGGRLSVLLLRDGHHVLVAGRSEQKLEAFVDANRGESVLFDISKDLTPLLAVEPDVIVDCIGPFQTYTDNPYRVAQFAIAHGINYLDLADDADFVRGICALNDDALRTGVFAISGVSSTPAITSSAVKSLAEDLSSIELINTSILPGSRAPRGQSTMQAILSQVGNTFSQWRNGKWVDARHWSKPVRIRLNEKTTRYASEFGAADAQLLPEIFDAKSVVFRAGLELPLMHHVLGVLGWLRSRKLTPPLDHWIPLFERCAAVLCRFGTDSGGMQIEVTGRLASSDGLVVKRWSVLSAAAVGPNIPAIAARAIIRNVSNVCPGARPGLCELPIATYVEAMSDLDIQFRTELDTYSSVFEQSLGEQWLLLDALHRRTHSVIDIVRLEGHAEVECGSSLIARVAALVFGFPKAGSYSDLKVIKERVGKCETWVRYFGDRKLKSTITASKENCVTEQFGLMKFSLPLVVDNGVLDFPVERGWFLGIPLPRFLLPTSTTTEAVTGNKLEFDVRLGLPLGDRLLVRYRGALRIVA